MDKELFKTRKEEILDKQKGLTKELSELREQYIQNSAPCKIDDRIILSHNSGRKEKMVVRGFGIFKDEVFIDKFTKIKEDGELESHFRYISTGHGNIERLSL